MIQAQALGYPAIGMADRNSLAGVVRAYAAQKQILENSGTAPRLLIGTRLVFQDGTPDIPGTLARAPAYAAADADILEFFPGRLCRKADELEPLLRSIVALKKDL